MIEFFNFSWLVHIFITFILGICILTQTLALVLNFYRNSLIKARIFENFLEISILLEILVFSLLHGQVVNGYRNGIVVPSGYENMRIFIFSLIVIFVISVSILNKTLIPISIIPATIISLPITESIIGGMFPYVFIISLSFLLFRSVKICVSSFALIKTSISALSVKNAIDTLYTGIMFSENDGYILLSNHQMQNLMLAITGKVFRNSVQFYKEIVSEKYGSRYKKVELDGQLVCLLPDETAWMFTKTDISFQLNNYVHISIADVSQQWALTSKLQLKNQELNYKSEELKKTIANLHVFSKQKEIENARMRAHDILGQRLSVLLSTIKNVDNIDYDLLTSLSKGLLDELKAEQIKMGPYDELKSIQQIFSAIGVDVVFEGGLPEDYKKASLFIDIIREGSTNAVRHGFATQIIIKAQYIEDSYNLTITNNGYTSSVPITPGSGIGVMKKKIGLQGGKLVITHYPLFTLSVVLPGGAQYD